MKQLCMLLCLLILVSALAGCAEKKPAETPAGTTASPVETKSMETAAPDTIAPETTASVSEAIILPDFSVKTADGSTFRLSEALKDHELVMINLFATWCGPCRKEFPYMQEALAQRSDQVAAVILSIEPEDTEEVLRQYADEMKLTIPVGREEGTDLVRFVDAGIPTSILVDRSGRVTSVEVGAKTSVQEFLDWFDGYSGEDYDPNLCTWTVCAYGSNNRMIPGVIFNFCTDTTCTPVTTDETGVAVFSGPPARYHVEIIGMPEGLKPQGRTEFFTEPYAQTFWVPFGENEK